MDSYFGNYCEAEPFSNPKCNIGPKCCEKAPEKVDGISPKVLNDTQNMKYDPNHNAFCELCEINKTANSKGLIYPHPPITPHQGGNLSWRYLMRRYLVRPTPHSYAPGGSTLEIPHV